MYKIATAQVWVHDQDEALDFYIKKLGMEVRQDVTVAEMGNFRWLTVGVPGQPDVAIVLRKYCMSASAQSGNSKGSSGKLCPPPLAPLKKVCTSNP